MPINPIDLQANFTQINHIGRQQSNIKDLEHGKEIQINLMVQKESENNSDDIPITKDLSEGPGKIKDEESNKKNKDKKEEKEKKKNEDEMQESEKEFPISKNPVIGSKIDIVG